MIPASYRNYDTSTFGQVLEDAARRDYENRHNPPNFAKARGGVFHDPVLGDIISSPSYPEEVRMKKKGGTILEEVEDDSWSAYFQQLWSALTSDEHLPKRFRKFVKAHGREPITSIKMVRAPVGTPGVIAVQLITAGKWNDLKNKVGIDDVFHTGILINGKYVIEKNEKLEAREEPGYASQGGKAETYDLDMGDQKDEMTIAELLEKGRKKMKQDFYLYNAFGHNCQSFVRDLAQASGFLDAEGLAWIKQDIKELVEEMPNVSKWLGVKLTDTARNVGNVGEELLAKRGGQIMGGQRRAVRGRGGFWTEAGF